MSYNNYNYQRTNGGQYGAGGGGGYDGGYGGGGGQYEMSGMGGGANGAGGGGDMQGFFDEISSLRDAIQAFNSNITTISSLHSRSLDSASPEASQRANEELERLVEDTRALSNDLKVRIKNLEKKGGTGRDAAVRKQQVAAVKSKFIEAIQNYQRVEQQYQTRYKQRIERQFKIVKPDASPDEIRAVVNSDEGGERVFSQALMDSNRFGQSRAAYREVQERHEDIKRIERTLGELAQLFSDMSVLVEQQDETINYIQTTAGNVEADTQNAYQQTEKAVVSARNARRGRWICFWICLVVIIIIVVVVLVELKPWQNAGKKN